MTAPHDTAPQTGATRETWRPRCIARLGMECRDCVECLSMIPRGLTCGDCAHIARCTAFGFTSSAANRFCDFVPSRFSARIATTPDAGGPA